MAPVSSHRLGQGLTRPTRQLGGIDQLGRGRAPHAREGEQIVDQDLHPLGPVDGEVDVLIRAVIELPGVAALERLAEAGHLAQRFLQIVRGDVGELLEVGVGSLELDRLVLQMPAGGLGRRELTDDQRAHGLHLAADLDDLAPPADVGQRRLEVSPGHPPRLLSEAGEWRRDDSPQQDGRPDHTDDDQGSGQNQGDEQEVRGARQVRAGPEAPGGQRPGEARQRSTDRVEQVLSHGVQGDGGMNTAQHRRDVAALPRPRAGQDASGIASVAGGTSAQKLDQLSVIPPLRRKAGAVGLEKSLLAGDDEAAHAGLLVDQGVGQVGRGELRGGDPIDQRVRRSLNVALAASASPMPITARLSNAPALNASHRPTGKPPLDKPVGNFAITWLACRPAASPRRR